MLQMVRIDFIMVSNKFFLEEVWESGTCLEFRLHFAQSFRQISWGLTAEVLHSFQLNLGFILIWAFLLCCNKLSKLSKPLPASLLLRAK